jgi:hypothetical protein
MMIERRRRVRVALIVGVALLAIVAGSVAAAAVGRGTGCAFTPQDRCLRVLFIGNSYTYVNDLPGTFARLAASGGHPTETSMIAPGGAFLADEAANPEVAAAIAGTRWTAVVLQEQSQRPASPTEAASLFAPAAARLVSQVTMAGARPLLLETWAHRDGWSELGQDYEAMQAAIDRAYAAVGAQTGAKVVLAGEAWRRAVRQDPSLALWQDDGSHPSPAGTYLAACVLYQTVTGESPQGLSDTEGLPAGTAAELQRIAASG